MNRQRSLVVLLLVVLLMTTLLVMAFAAPGQRLLQPAATQQQQTVQAAVDQFFTQTAAAQQPIGLTQTAEAQLASTSNIQATIEAEFNQQLTATAEFDALIEEQFNQQLTATAIAAASVFGGVDPMAVVIVEFRDNDDDTFVQLERDDDDAWGVVAGTNTRNLPVDQILADEALMTLLALDITNEPGNQNLEDNGLDEPGFTLQFTNADDTIYSLDIGDVRRNGSRYRALVRGVPGDDTGMVYEVRANPVEELLELIRRPPYLIPPELEPTIAEIQVAEQLFEGGRMMWVEPTRQIWVLLVDAEGGGRWLVFDDTFAEGELEIDPAIDPPEGLIQPVRGFGKLWREDLELREALGWAITPEFGFISDYRYDPGGEFDDDGQIVFQPGVHTLFTLNSELLQFNEDDSTWQLGNS